MKMTYFIPFLVFLLTFSLSSSAEVYKWVDDKGILHFTDDITQVPEKYRRTLREVQVTEGTRAREGEQNLQKKDAGVFKDRLGRGEEYWRGRVEEWRKKLQFLEERVESLRGKYNELTEKFNSSKSSAERAMIRNEREQIKGQIDQLRLEITQAKEMLEKKIPDEGALFGAKPEWTRP